MKLSSRKCRIACTIVEAAMTAAIVAVFLTGLYDSVWRAMGFLKAGIDGTSVTRLMEARLECLRNATYNTLTSPTTLGNLVLSATATPTGVLRGDLGGLAETVTVTEYVDPRFTTPYQAAQYDSGASIQVTSSNGVVTTGSAGDGSLPYWMQAGWPVLVDVQEKWKATFNPTPCWREMSTVVTNGGALGRGLN